MSFAEGYKDVASRIVEFRTKHPEGSLRPVNPLEPITIRSIGDKTYLEYVAEARRGPDDAYPGIGVAWEPFPGRTPYTRDSEAMVAETSAWGRAIVAALAADTRTGVASADEVRVRQQERDRPRRNWVQEIDTETDAERLRALWQDCGESGDLTEALRAHFTSRAAKLAALDAQAAEETPTDDPWQTTLPDTA